MRLALKAIGTDRPRQAWSFERGRRVIGRSPECDWQLADDERRVSKLHCTLTRDQAGFILVDQSANGTIVNGVLLREGESVRLANGAHVEFGGRVFAVEISGEAEADFGDPDPSLRMSDEPLTISAILADVAPGGRLASGILAGPGSDDDLPVPETERGVARKSISQDVEIGWSGPPSTTIGHAVLPEDWNEEPGNSSRHEHTDARRTSVLLARSAGPIVRETGTERETTTVPTHVDGLIEPMPFAMPRLSEALARLDRESAECLAVLAIEEIVSRPARTEADLLGHVEQLIQRQQRLTTALEDLIERCEQSFEPRRIEAIAEPGQGRLGWLRRIDPWTTYTQQFTDSGRRMSVREFLQKAARGGNTQSTGSVDGLHGGADT